MNPMRLNFALACLLGLSLFSTAATPARAARTRPIGLSDMAARAGKIFLGRCTGRTSGIDPRSGIPFTSYTFEILSAVKGVDPGSTSFRLPGTPDRPYFPEVPSFEPGVSYLLALYPASASGFSAPVGLDQGAFRVRRGTDGRDRAVNARGNHGLLADVDPVTLASRHFTRAAHGALEVETLLSILRELVPDRRR